MDLDFKFYEDNDEYIVTQSGNKVSKKSILYGSKQIVLLGKVVIENEAVLRGELSTIRVGEHCVISKGVNLIPPSKKLQKGLAYFPMYIGNNVFFGENSTIQAAQIGSYVYIGANCTIGKRSVLKDCCRIEDGTVIPSETVVASFRRYSGKPGVAVDEEDLPESMQHCMIDHTVSYYYNLIPKSKCFPTQLAN